MRRRSGRIVAPSVEYSQDDFFGFATPTATFALNASDGSERQQA